VISPYRSFTFYVDLILTIVTALHFTSHIEYLIQTYRLLLCIESLLNNFRTIYTFASIRFFDNLIVTYFLGPPCVTKYKRRYAPIMFILFLFKYSSMQTYV